MYAGSTCDLCERPVHEDTFASWSTRIGVLVICVPCNGALMDRLDDSYCGGSTCLASDRQRPDRYHQ